MQIAQERAEGIEHVIRCAYCPRDFDCYRTGFEHLCKAVPIANTDLVVCREQSMCSFQIPFGGALYCSCSVRKYIAMKLGM